MLLNLKQRLQSLRMVAGLARSLQDSPITSPQQ